MKYTFLFFSVLLFSGLCQAQDEAPVSRGMGEKNCAESSRTLSGIEPASFNVDVYPDQEKGMVKLEINSAIDTRVTVSINALDGRDLANLGSFTCQQGITVETLRIRHLRAGFYVMEVRDPSGERTMLFELIR